MHNLQGMKQAKIPTVKRIVLDHFFVSFNAEELKDLKRLTQVMPGITHAHVRSGKDAWEGVYLQANVGNYFEMIRVCDLATGCGIAWSGDPIQYVDIRKITRELSHLKWNKGTRLLGTTKKKWFDWVAIKVPKSENPEFESWLMHYYFIERHRPVKAQSAVDRFNKVTVTMDEKQRSYVRKYAAWFPGVRKYSKSSTTIKIPSRDRGDFVVEIKFKKNFGQSQFSSLEAQLRPDAKAFRIPRLKYFKLNRKGLKLILSRSET